MKRCVLRQGLDATTLREIGREAGFTTGVITHHFPDKAAVVRACFETVSNDWIGGVEQRMARAADAHEKLVELIRIALPLDPAQQCEWRLWAEMWTYAGADPDFVAVLVEVDGRWEQQLLALLHEARDAELLHPEVDVEAQAGIVVRLIDGLGLRAWLTDGWGPARRRLAHHLASLMREPDAERWLLERAELPLVEAAR